MVTTPISVKHTSWCASHLSANAVHNSYELSGTCRCKKTQELEVLIVWVIPINNKCLIYKAVSFKSKGVKKINLMQQYYFEFLYQVSLHNPKSVFGWRMFWGNSNTLRWIPLFG